MIIDTTKHKRHIFDMRLVPMDKLIVRGVQQQSAIEYWYVNGEVHCYGGFNTFLMNDLKKHGAKSFIATDLMRACNKCGRFLEPTGQQKSFGRLYKCPGCSVAWWGKPSSLPADQETRTARKLTADMLKLVKDIAPNAAIKHQLRPLGVLNKDEARFEKFKLIDLSYISNGKRKEIVEEAYVEGLFNSVEHELAKQVANRTKSIKHDMLFDEVINPDTCEHNWNWVGIDEACTNCGITKKAVLFGGLSVDDLKEPQDLCDDVTVDDVHIESGKIFFQSPQVVTLPPGMQFKSPIKKTVASQQCSHSWNYSTDRCYYCGVTKEALLFGTMALDAYAEPPAKEPEQTSGRMIDLE